VASDIISLFTAHWPLYTAFQRPPLTEHDSLHASTRKGSPTGAGPVRAAGFRLAAAPLSTPWFGRTGSEGRTGNLVGGDREGA